jgi:type IV fimbrial biogenesis protein FimT
MNLTRILLIRQGGFTLVELAATVLIGTLLLTLAVPSMVNTVRNNTLTASANDLVGALNIARSEAIKRRVPVRVCKSFDGAACSIGANWEAGWLIFADNDNDDTLDSGELLRVYSGLDTNYTLRDAGNFTDWVEFLPSGASQGSDGASDTFRLCYGNSTALSRAVNVAMSGRVKLLDQPAASCS